MSESKLVSFAVGHQNAILVETDTAAVRGQYVAVGSGVAAKIPTSFEEALDRVRPAASILLAKMRDIEVQPDELEVEFGIKLSAEFGALVAKSAGEANFTVKLVWKKK